MGDTVIVIPEELLRLNETKDGMVLPRVVPRDWTFGGYTSKGSWKEFFEKRICGHVRDTDNSVIGGGIE